MEGKTRGREIFRAGKTRMIKQMKNPNGTYRILLKDVDFELLWSGQQEPCLVGELANLIGAYLDTGLTPKEIEQLKRI